MISTFLSTLLGKLAIATMALAATTGGLAATDNLPDPVQQWVSDVVADIGIDIPAPSDVDLPDQADGVDRPVVPDLPEDVADTANDVVGTVFDGEPIDDGQGFGEDVADAASDTAPGDSAGVADDYTGEAGSQADDGAANADDAGSQGVDGVDNADVADDYTEDAGSEAGDYRP